ncbi:MAG: polysaccharide biosynthesis C-terminal domain-containing protein [Truepera sp.]|nr:polysaccharide biosynthesis C-terminal domain-containing protein [Truepera sp.]
MKQSLVRVAAYFGAIGVSQLLSFILIILITHFLSPKIYGEYVLALTISSLAGMVGSAWVRNVGMRLYIDAKQSRETRGFFWNLALLQASLFSALYGIVLVAFWLLSLELASLPSLIAAGIAILIGDFFSLNLNLIRIEERSTGYAIAESGSAAVRFLSTLGGLLIGFHTPAMLFLAASLAYLLGAFYATYLLNSSLSGPLRFQPALLRRVLHLGPASIPLSLSGWVEQLADRLILERFTTVAIVGIYSAGYALADRLLGGIIAAVFMMAWPDVLNAWSRGGVSAARLAIFRAQQLYSWLTLGPALFIILFHLEIVTLLGPAFREAAPVIPIIVAATWLRGFIPYLNRHLELRKQFAKMSLITSIGALLNLVLNFLLIPHWSMVGAAWATLVAYLIMAVIFWWLRDRDQQLPSDYLKAALLGGLAWVVSTVLPVPSFFQMAIFVAIYALGAYAIYLRPQLKRQPAGL